MMLRIVSPQGIVRECECKSVGVRSREAEYEVLDFHAPLVSVIRHGSVVIDAEESVAVDSGLVCIGEGRCLVLVEEQKAKSEKRKA